MRVLITTTFELDEPQLVCNWEDQAEVDWFETEALSELILHSNNLGDSLSSNLLNKSVEYIKEDTKDE